jgi:dienelactone hydrolase
MIKRINNYKNAVIILHEIYGINRFIEDLCSKYHSQEFDVFCPDMLGRNSFSYAEASEAYDYFIKKVGFDYYKVIEQLVEQLKHEYDQVFLIGFSVGATIAWRCCENVNCDGIICCYGSRIRDYLWMQPCSQVLLLFAEQDSFNVDGVISQLQEKPNVEIHKFKARHGFMDQFSENFDREQAQISQDYIYEFLK